MKIIILLSMVFSISAFARGGGGGSVYVNGYTKSNGTYVQPHERSAPNQTINDNWSTKGNTNPYTGKEGTIEPSGYSYPNTQTENNAHNNDKQEEN